MSAALWILVIAVVLVVVGGAAFVATRARGRDLELEPTPDDRRSDTVAAPAAVEETPPASSVDIAVPTEAVAAPVEVEPEVVEEAPPAEAEAPPEQQLEPLVKPSFFDRLGKARSAFSGYLGGLVGRGKLTEDDWEELEEALIQADVGVATSMSLIGDVRDLAKGSGADSGEDILGLLKARMHRELEGKDRSLTLDEGKTNVWLFVGVNGVGKTTTIGKVARRLVDEGHKPLLAAGDTFRAAAAEQLTTWGERAGADVVRGNEGGDPSAVIFDGVQAAAARGCDVVLADTAGRLHNKTNLMEELSKVRRVAGREPGHVSEVLLVIDATTGQNGMSQAKVFTEAVEVTGVVLTKLDGSAKGGIVFAIESELGIPVKLVGLGEKAGDLVDFDAPAFVDALFE
ncbi:MAG: signal recognition particle-docking protein FtsY [Acidimicrobiia bacterium]|nr:signal recognition particle-docking protein FtsY [Acidimicrobiia bacterium]MDH5290921.1 signal recognition particle-docking protein FtsY [Acidimicrobiia bacterium]